MSEGFLELKLLVKAKRPKATYTNKPLVITSLVRKQIRSKIIIFITCFKI